MLRRDFRNKFGAVIEELCFKRRSVFRNGFLCSQALVVVRIVYDFSALLDSCKPSTFKGVRVAVVRRGNKRIACVIRYNFISDFHKFVFYNAIVFQHGIPDFSYVAVCIVLIYRISVFDKESPAVILIRMIAEFTIRNTGYSAEFICSIRSCGESGSARRDAFFRNNVRELLERFAVFRLVQRLVRQLVGKNTRAAFANFTALVHSKFIERTLFGQTIQFCCHSHKFILRNIFVAKHKSLHKSTERIACRALIFKCPADHNCA